MTEEGFIVSSWGKKYIIKYEDFVNGEFTCSIGKINFEEYLGNEVSEPVMKDGQSSEVIQGEANNANPPVEEPLKYISTPEMIENLAKMEDFFKRNYNAKIWMMRLAPDSRYANDRKSLIEWADNLERVLKDLEYDFMKMADDLQLSETEKDLIKNKFAQYRGELYRCSTNYDKLRQFYIKNISDMDEKFVNQVGDKIYGWGGPTDLSWFIKESSSINELLHLLHSAMMNNNRKYSSLPVLFQKTNDINEKITLYGVETEISRDLYESIPTSLDVGITDIVSFSDGKKIMMMVRDRGHALSIEIDIDGDKVSVKYFIPKICNVDMVNNLKGVTPVNENSEYAVGTFDTTTENLSQDLVDFIGNVPTDGDIQSVELDLLTISQDYKNNEKTGIGTSGYGIDITKFTIPEKMANLLIRSDDSVFGYQWNDGIGKIYEMTSLDEVLELREDRLLYMKLEKETLETLVQMENDGVPLREMAEYAVMARNMNKIIVRDRKGVQQKCILGLRNVCLYGDLELNVSEDIFAQYITIKDEGGKKVLEIDETLIDNALKEVGIDESTPQNDEKYNQFLQIIGKTLGIEDKIEQFALGPSFDQSYSKTLKALQKKGISDPTEDQIYNQMIKSSLTPNAALNIALGISPELSYSWPPNK